MRGPTALVYMRYTPYGISFRVFEIPVQAWDIFYNVFLDALNEYITESGGPLRYAPPTSVSTLPSDTSPQPNYDKQISFISPQSDFRLKTSVRSPRQLPCSLPSTLSSVPLLQP